MTEDYQSVQHDNERMKSNQECFKHVCLFLLIIYDKLSYLFIQN